MEQFLMRMPKKLKDKLRELACKRGLTLNALLLQSAWELVETSKEYHEKNK